MYFNHLYLYIQFSSVAQSCPTLCGPMNHSMPGLPVHRQLRVYSNSCIIYILDDDDFNMNRIYLRDFDGFHPN